MSQLARMAVVISVSGGAVWAGDAEAEFQARAQALLEQVAER